MECFCVNSQEIEGAINPERYINQLSFNKQVKIKNIAEVTQDLFVPARSYPNENFDWLRIDKVEKGGFLSEYSIITTKGDKINKSSVQFAEEGDILLARLVPSLSNEKILIAPKTKNKLVVSGEFIVLSLKDINPEIMVNILRTKRYLKYILSKGRGGTPSRLRIDRNDFLELDFPKISPEDIQKITELTNGLNDNLISKETESQKLLDSINDYVLDELGIKLPELKDKMTYVVMSEDVKNNRCDSYYFQPKFEEVEEAINKGKFEVKELKKITDFVSGYAFSSNDYLYENGIKLLTIKNIKEDKIDLGNSTLLPNEYYDKYSKFQIRKEDIVIAMTGATIGKSFIFDFDENVLLNQRVGILRTSMNLNKYYLLSFMKSQIFRQKIIRQSCGGAQPNISEIKITSIKIPLPPLSVQNKIADEVKKRMQKAETLQKEVKEELEKAKREVEKIILNN